MTASPDLAAWLREAVLERKAAAEKAATVAGPRWHHDRIWPETGPATVMILSDAGSPLADMLSGSDEEMAPHIAANDPRSVIARCEAELAILDECDKAVRIARTYKDATGTLALAEAKTWLDAVRLLGSGYRHRDGYLEEWKS